MNTDNNKSSNQIIFYWNSSDVYLIIMTEEWPEVQLEEVFVIFSESLPFYNVHIAVGNKIKWKDNNSMLVVHEALVMGFKCE